MLRALVIASEGALSSMIAALVAPRGFEVRAASSAARGLEDALTWSPHVVLVDVALDGAQGGIDLCEKLRAARATMETPVLLIVSDDDDELKRRAAQAGATAVFERPFSPLALLKEIEAVTKR